MNDDARFFFYLSGFVGFLLFFLLGILLTKDFMIALVQSSFGCLFFAICGRWILSFILNGIIVDSTTEPLDSHSSGKLLLSTAEATVVDGNKLGQIDFQSPVDDAGTDAIVVGASILAEADATFSASVNSTDLVFLKFQ